MSSRSPKLYIQDILQACEDILNFTQGLGTADELQNDRRTFLAVIHSIEVIGEAARQTPKSFKEKHPEIPWRETIGLRNVIAHEYFGLDIEIIWDVIQTQIPVLAEQMRKVNFDWIWTSESLETRMFWNRENLMPLSIECVENDMTLGEICNALRGVWGGYVAEEF